MVFRAPRLTGEEEAVLELIRDQWKKLKHYLVSKPRPWSGLVRQATMARGIRGSNSIEGFEVSDDDAAAAVEQDQPFDADPIAKSWLAVTGYREAMTYALRQGDDDEGPIDASLIRSLHFMMMQNAAPDKRPGGWRPGEIYVRDEELDKTVYEGPDRKLVPGLVVEMIKEIDHGLAAGSVASPMIVAAMAHLNLAMIHPFSDGNGRMARCLQTLVLAKAGVFDPVFCSVEEWLGRKSNTLDYYAVLAEVGGGSWQPSRDARPWIRFLLKAHHQQAETAERRHTEAGRLWGEIEQTVSGRGLPERAVAPLVEAAYGRAIRNSRYRFHTEVSIQVASRDLATLVAAGLLEPTGSKSGRRYAASPDLKNIRQRTRELKELRDPFELV